MPQDGYSRDRRTWPCASLRAALRRRVRRACVCACTGCARRGRRFYDTRIVQHKIMQDARSEVPGDRNPASNTVGARRWWCRRRAICRRRRRRSADGPNWPKDPDIAAGETAKVKEKPAPHADWVDRIRSRPLRPSELNVPGANTAPSTGVRHAAADYPANEPKKTSSASTFQEGGIRDVYRRTGADEPDRSAARLSDAVAGSALRHRPGQEEATSCQRSASDGATR